MSAKVVSAVVLMAAVMSSGAVRVHAQDKSKSDAPATVPLKVTVNIARYNGEKKTASLPFVMWVNTGDRESGSIQIGSEVPVPTTTFSPLAAGGAATTPTTSYSYKSLGTNITCTATVAGDGLYRLYLSVNDSQVFSPSSAGALGPVIQSFRSTNSPILRDGQTVQFAVATDKTSGEVIKLDVTLNLVK